MTVDLGKLGNLATSLRDRGAPARREPTGRSWYRIENAMGGTAELYLYDVIGDWGVTSGDFVNDLRGVGAQALDLHINSEGGSVFDGVAIYTALKQHPAQVTTYVDSLAASISSVIAMAGDHVVMAKNARMMIHMAQGLVLGTAADMRETADLLDDLSGNIASIYADKAGGTVKSWLKSMGAGAGNSGTWFDAASAVKAGLADSIDVPTPKTPENTSGTETETATRWDPALFASITKGVFA